MGSLSLVPSRQKNQIILVWAGDEPTYVRADSHIFWVPGIAEVADHTQKGTRYRVSSAKDASNRPLPGTIVLEDVFEQDPQTHETKPVFSVGQFENTLVDIQKGLINSNVRDGLFGMGLALTRDPEQVKDLQRQARPLWEASMAQSWQNELMTEQARQEPYQKKGLQAPPLSRPQAQAITSAARRLAEYRKRETQAAPGLTYAEVVAALNGQDTPAIAAPAVKIGGENVGASLVEEAESRGVRLKNAQLLGLIKNEPETIAEVRALLAPQAVSA